MIRYLVERAWWFWPSFALACSALAWGVEYKIGCDKARRAWRDGYEQGCDDEAASWVEPHEPGEEWAAELAAMPHIASEPDLPRPEVSALSTAPSGPGQPETRDDGRCSSLDVSTAGPASLRGSATEVAGSIPPPAVIASRLTPAQRRRAKHKRRGPYRPQAHPAVLAALAAQFTPPEPSDPAFWDRLADVRDAAYAFVDGWAAAA